MLPIKPRGPKHNGGGPALKDLLLALVLRAAIRTQRVRYVILDIRRSLAPVKDVVGTDVDEGCAESSSRVRYVPRRFSVHCERQILIGFGRVNVVVGGGVNDPVRLDGFDLLIDGVSVSNVQLANIGRINFFTFENGD
jgi:hypothetical protein